MMWSLGSRGSFVPKNKYTYGVFFGPVCSKVRSISARLGDCSRWFSKLYRGKPPFFTTIWESMAYLFPSIEQQNSKKDGPLVVLNGVLYMTTLMAKDEFLTGATYPKSNWSGVTPYLPMTNSGPILEWYRGYLLSLLYPKKWVSWIYGSSFPIQQIILYGFFMGVDPRQDPTSISWLPGIFWGLPRWEAMWRPSWTHRCPLVVGKKHHRYVPGS